MTIYTEILLEEHEASICKTVIRRNNFQKRCSDNSIWKNAPI